MLLIIKILFKINCFDTLNDEKSLEYFLEKENFLNSVIKAAEPPVQEHGPCQFPLRA